jgi:hypothetical protein
MNLASKSRRLYDFFVRHIEADFGTLGFQRTDAVATQRAGTIQKYIRRFNDYFWPVDLRLTAGVPVPLELRVSSEPFPSSRGTSRMTTQPGWRH